MAHHDDEDFGALLAAFEEEQKDTQRAAPQPGDKVTATIVSIGEEVAFVDLGAKSEGLVDRAELEDADGRLTVSVGDQVEGVIGAIDESGSPVVRTRPGRGEAARSQLRLAWEEKLPVEGMVAAAVKGGAEVTVAGMRAFCPVSQLADSFVENVEDFLGQRLDFRIQRFEEKGRHTNIVLSRRVLLEEESARRAAVLRETLKVGQVLRGTVSSVTSYGAFVDLGGLEGLLHVSEMAYERVDDPRERLKEGQRIEVQVTRIEPAKKAGRPERISLSTRALERDPWQDVESRFPPGTETEGRVMRLETFGAFVQLAPGIEGLVHISKLGAEDRASHARQVVELGQDLRVKVLEVDPGKRRLALERLVEAVEDPLASEVESYRARRQPSPGGGFGSLGDFFEKSRKQREK